MPRVRLFALIFALLVAQVDAPAAPQVLRIDGSLFNSSGAPLTGNRDIQIKAYDAVTGGSPVWTSSVYNTAVSGGRFSIALDATVDTTSLTDRLAAKVANGEIWFEIHYDTGTANGTMNSDVAVAPRIRGRGTMFALVAAKADALTGVTTTVAELNHLAGVTAGVQTQLNALQAPTVLAGALHWTLPTSDGGNNQLMKFNATTKTFYWDNDAGAAGGVTGPGSSVANALTRWNGTAGTTLKSSNVVLSDADTISGLVGLTTASLNVSGLTGSRVVVTDSAQNLATASNVDTTELDFLDGVTSNLGSKVNRFTNAEAGYLSGVTSNLGAKVNLASAAEMGRLAGVTSGIQSQIDSAFSAINSIPSATNRVAKIGDTMTGGLGFQYAGVTPSRVAYIDANRQLMTSNTVTNTELDFLSGVTSNLGARVNLFTNAEAGYLAGVTSIIGSKLNLVTASEVGRLAGVTSGIQSQIDAAFSAIANSPSATGRIARTGDTMSGTLGLAGANTTPDRVAYLNANRELVTSTIVSSAELDFIDGVTSNVGSKLNLFTNTEAGYLSSVTTNIGSKLNRFSSAEASYLAGVTSGIQSQIDSAFSTISNLPLATGRIARTGDTMSGMLGFAYAGVTPSRVAYIGANRELQTSTVVDNAELDFIDGVTSNLGAKINLFTATEAGRLSGVTSGIQSQIDGAFSAISSIPSATTRVAKTGDSMSGALAVGALIASSTAFDTNGVGGKYKIGGQTLLSVGTGWGARNTLVGLSAGVNITWGYSNTAVGAEAGRELTASGIQNSFFGELAGVSVSTGGQNAFFGSSTGSRTQTGVANSFFGTAAGTLNLTGSYNSYFGSSAGGAQTGDYNVMMGASAGGAGAGATGSYNSVVGYNAGRLLRSAADSAFLGNAAGYNVTTGYGNTFVGSGADDTGSAAIRATGVGYGAIVTASSAVQLGAGVNATANSLQFWDYNFLNKNGAATFSSVNGVTTVTSAYLNGLTGNVQAQLSAAAGSGASSVAKGGDTMTGALGLAYANVTPDRVAYVDGSRQLRTSANVDSAELDFLDGVTASLGSKVNLFTAAEAAYLAGVTSNIGAKDNLFTATQAGYLGGVTSSLIAQLGGVTSNVGAKLNLATASELGNLSGVTSNLGAKVNLFTATEAGRLAGVTSGIQSQIDAAFSAITSAPSATGRIARTGDTMSGNLGLAGANTTPDRVAYLNANRELVTSTVVSSAELDFLDGVTSKVSDRINLFTNTEAGYLAGVTTSLGSKLNLFTATEAGYLSGVTASIAAKENLYTSAQAGYLGGVTTSLIGWLGGVTSNLGGKVNLFSATEAGRLAGVTSGIQSQIDSAFSAISSLPLATARVARTGDTMTGNLGFAYAGVTPSRVAYVGANRELQTSSLVDNTELDFLDGVTSNIGAKENLFTTAQAGYLGGVTSSLIAQLGGVTANLAGQLNGLTSNVAAKLNLASASEMSYLAGVTASIQTQLRSYWGQYCSAGYYLQGFDISGTKMCSALPTTVSFTKVRRGHVHTCGLLSDSTMMCWGYGGNGRIGDGFAVTTNVPVYVRASDGSKLSGVVELGAGYVSTCALKADGTVWCWGSNGTGAVGDGTTTQRILPTQALGLTNVTQMSLGGQHGCARKSDGSAWCWGDNSNGQIGDSSTTDRTTPKAILGATSSVVQVSAGAYNTCALLATGKLKCWGVNAYGSVGDGSTTQRTSPVDVLDSTGVGQLSGVTYVAAGEGNGTNTAHHACAVKSNGTVYCWGSGIYGALGNGGTTNQPTPVQVTGISSAVKVTVGVITSCALLSDGTAKCWGYGGQGARGDGTTSATQATAVDVVGTDGTGILSSVTDVDLHDGMGSSYGGSVISNGRIYSFGDNANNQFGDGTATDSSVPKGAFGP